MLEAHANLYLPINANTLHAVLFGGGRNNFLNEGLIGRSFGVGSAARIDSQSSLHGVAKNSMQNNLESGRRSNAKSVDLAQSIALLASYEIACLFFIMHLPQLKPNDGGALEQLLFECIKACRSQNTNGNIQEQVSSEAVISADNNIQSHSDEFVSFCVEQLDVEKMHTGYELLATYKVVPIDEQTLLQKEFLDDSGMWNYEFCQQHRQTLQQELMEVNVRFQSVLLSAEQSRVYREFMAGQDEHIHIQGYAGTGKTTLIKSLISIFETTSARLLVLAERKNQLDIFLPMAAHNDRVDVLTYTDLAKLIISRNTTERGEETILRKGMTRGTMPDSDIIRHLGLVGSGAINANQLVKAVRATVYAYCQSDEDELNSQHIPKRYKATLDKTTQGALCQYANRLWQSILSPPTKDFTPQIRAYHIIKWAALNRCVIPDEYTHVLIDECHDLSGTMNQILSNSPQARISLGDDYQNLNGYLMKPQGEIRQREMHHSLRSSHQIENLVNPIIGAHPSRVNATFFGNRMNRLELEYYEKAAVPKDPSLILVKDLWGLFEWMQRLASGRVAINLLSSVSDLDIFVQDCIELYSNGTRARHGQLFRFTSWQQLSKHYQNNPAFLRVSRMLERQYSQQDWQQTRNLISSSASLGYSLALVDNVRNLEYDSVMVTPQVVTLPESMSSKYASKNSVSTNPISRADQNNERIHKAVGASFYATLYVAVTRARKQLILPELLRHHIEDIA